VPEETRPGPLADLRVVTKGGSTGPSERLRELLEVAR
jgi:hypothetical protein